jgi:hypothetical protein
VACDGDSVFAELLDQAKYFGAGGVEFLGNFCAADYDCGVVGEEADDAVEACVGGFESGGAFADWSCGGDG